MKTIGVVVAGACGRMGSETVRAVMNEPDLRLEGAVDARCVGEDAGLCNGLPESGARISKTLAGACRSGKVRVLVDFTTAESAFERACEAVRLGARPIIGTTGLDAAQVRRLASLCEKQGVGGLLAPNFAIGAVLLMKFAAEAARFLPDVEIVELHHNQKFDYPSGTALRTAEMIAAARRQDPAGCPDRIAKVAGARGGVHMGVPIHSVRLPGLIAHQEALFGALGQTLSIRHDTTSRESFMPGVILAVRKAVKLKRLVVGLESLI